MDDFARAFEALGAAVLVVGVLWSGALAIIAWRRTGSGRAAYDVLRRAFGGTLLLALEVLVAADLIRTVAVAPTLDNVLVLGLIVVIRTLLSFSLETEIEGVPPWRRAMLSGAAVVGRSTRSVLQDEDPRSRPPTSR
ncbi:MAG TPA: DUF1622 domain-containing protein [Marmoricola sp.]|jgi:uncharacterized membrane protein